MLLNPALKHGTPVEVDAIHNYYEQLVIREIQSRDYSTDNNFLADVACVALNHLPPRYIRYDVDMSFYLSPHELMEIEEKVAEAVTKAIEHVNNQKGRPADDDEH